MLILITYDVNTESSEGRRRLRQVAQTCEDYGQRVQNSVFECLLDPQQLKQLQLDIEKIVDPKKDSIRYYYLGSNWKNKVEHIGIKQGYDPEGVILV